jgi:serine/threonine protein kinase
MSTNEHARKRIENYSYSLADVIGSGYSSKVYRGREESSRELPVALKVIDMKALKNDVHRTLLMNEIECLRDLADSQHCIRMLDVYTTKNNTYIITELCREGDLAKTIETRGPLKEAQALEIMAQVVRGYLDVHAKGIIHRDLKPANVFFNAVWKLADFGFAVRASGDEPTRYSYNVGSPLYMPPEALANNLYSFKSDIWALGIIFYELLTAKTPWLASSEKELERRIRHESITGLIPPGLTPKSQELLRRCLEPRFEDRMGPSELRVWLQDDRGLASISQLTYSASHSKQLREIQLSGQKDTAKENDKDWGDRERER